MNGAINFLEFERKFETILLKHENEFFKMLDETLALCKYQNILRRPDTSFVEEKLENYDEEITLSDVKGDVGSFYNELLTQQNTLEKFETSGATDFVSNQAVEKSKIGLSLQSEIDEGQRSHMEQSRSMRKLTLKDLDSVSQKYRKQKAYFIEMKEFSIIDKGGTMLEKTI